MRKEGAKLMDIDFSKPEIIAIFISIISLVGTCISWVYILIQNRKNIEVRILSYDFGSEGVLLYIQFVNRSRLPIAITDLLIQQNKMLFPCSKLPGIALTHTIHKNKDTLYRHDYPQTVMPIALSTLAAYSGYVYFPNHPNNPISAASSLTFLISSNRGGQEKRILSLDQVNKLQK